MINIKHIYFTDLPFQLHNTTGSKEDKLVNILTGTTSDVSETDLQFFVIFNKFSVVSGRCYGDNVSLRAMEPRLYRKHSKIWDTSNNCHNCPKNRKV